MITPNEKEKKAIKLIAGSQEGAVFAEYLIRDLTEKDIANRQKEDTELYRGQGAAIEIDELILLVK